MPSHPDRVRQNYCRHEFPHLDREFLSDEYDDVPDGRKCIKCGMDFDIATGRKPKLELEN